MKTATAIAANRFGLGARPGELTAIDGRHQAWLLDQLQGPSARSSALKQLPTTTAIWIEVEEVRAMRRAAKKAGKSSADVPKKYGATVRQIYLEHMLARYHNAATTNVPFHERLVHFWTNHFAVSVDKQPLPALAGAFENEAIRPHLGGGFSELLLAVEKHAAMLSYLDNARSVGPNSTLGKRSQQRSPNKRLGLNENLAREILELHTLGVNGGYAQDDVRQFAHALTGWSIGGGSAKALRSGTPGMFVFRPALHEPGAVTVMATRYSQSGVEQAEAILDQLATHPATARHIATKLARHFVADDPPQPLIDKLASVFLKTGGDLPALHEALITSVYTWRPTTGKYKSPHDFLLSAMRAFDHQPDNARLLFKSLEALGQAPWRPGSPAGWPDTAQEWGGADALFKRIEWATAAADFAGRRVDPIALGEVALGPNLSARTRSAITRAESTMQGVTLLLASPDFQRR